MILPSPACSRHAAAGGAYSRRVRPPLARSLALRHTAPAGSCEQFRLQVGTARPPKGADGLTKHGDCRQCTTHPSGFRQGANSLLTKHCVALKKQLGQGAVGVKGLRQGDASALSDFVAAQSQRLQRTLRVAGERLGQGNGALVTQTVLGQVQRAQLTLATPQHLRHPARPIVAHAVRADIKAPECGVHLECVSQRIGAVWA
mmetsp:Transcript_2308/g.8256  ORF Transcript_2308/g.8256 Transcript_2308/m.8256 type:complete len:202 (+) Transcript_2308:234-839(+)